MDIQQTPGGIRCKLAKRRSGLFFSLSRMICNAIEPLLPIQAASFLLRQAEQVVGWMLDDSIYSRLYRLTSELARKVPAYKLRFTQKGGLWPLIDEVLNAESI